VLGCCCGGLSGGRGRGGRVSALWQRERFIALYLEALDEAGLPDDEPFRQAVREHVEFGAGVAQRNSWAQTDADLHPIREVPRWQWPA
jgi:hemoglobin